MEYSVKSLGKLAGISPRTLRYYDQIGLLTPERKAATEYRVYGRKEVDRLQLILFYRELGVPLKVIQKILDAPGFDALGALRKQREKILIEKRRLDALTNNLNKTIAALEGKNEMTDIEKFEGFKQSLVNENEKKYGHEIREKFGPKVVEDSYKKLKGMDARAFERAKELERVILEELKEAMQTGGSAGEKAQQVAALHKEWLCMFWETYSREAHENLARMYVEDERFKAYYEKCAPGAAEFLRDSIFTYLDLRAPK